MLPGHALRHKRYIIRNKGHHHTACAAQANDVSENELNVMEQMNSVTLVAKCAFSNRDTRDSGDLLWEPREILAREEASSPFLVLPKVFLHWV